MQKNADGSYDIYFAPKPREGKEGNWLQTIPGKSWWLALPMYGPLEPWIDQTWVTNDFERSLGVNLKVPVPVVVHGSLARPDYRVGKGVVLLSLTDLATKIAVPQVLLVDAFGAAIAGNPCVKMATGGVEQPTAAPVEKLTEPVGQALKATTAVVERTGKVVKEAGGAVVVVKGAGGLLKGVGRAVGGFSAGDSKRPIWNKANPDRICPGRAELRKNLGHLDRRRPLRLRPDRRHLGHALRITGRLSAGLLFGAGSAGARVVLAIPLLQLRDPDDAGLRDVLPLSLYADSLTYMETVLGQFYLAALVAALVSAYLSDRESTSETAVRDRAAG